MTRRLRFLICPPTFFAVSYVINPWMQGHVDDVQIKQVHLQWQALYDALSQRADVVLVDAASGLPTCFSSPMLASCMATTSSGAASAIPQAAVRSRFRTVVRGERLPPVLSRRHVFRRCLRCPARSRAVTPVDGPRASHRHRQPCRDICARSALKPSVCR